MKCGKKLAAKATYLALRFPRRKINAIKYELDQEKGVLRHEWLHAAWHYQVEKYTDSSSIGLHVHVNCAQT